MLARKLFGSVVLTGIVLLGAAATPAAAAESPVHSKLQNRVQIGDASWYGAHHQGRPTASGEPYDPRSLTAAHPTLPIDSIVRVTNVKNGLWVDVRINDRGPYRGHRVIDLSTKAAETIGLKRRGVARVKVEPLRPQPIAYHPYG